MKIHFLIFSFLFFLNTLSFSQDTPPNNSLLYRIEKPGNKGMTSYLFGTKHNFKSSFIDTSKVISRILDSVKIIAEECNSEEYDTAIIISKIQMGDEYYTYDSEEQEKTVRQLIKAKLPESVSYLRLKPIVYIILFGFFEVGFVNEDLTLGENIDDYFIRRGKEMNKELVYFEDFDYQISLILDSVSVSDQCKMLAWYAENQDLMSDYSKEMTDCYEAADIDCIYQKSKTSLSDELFVVRRNKAWMENILRILNKAPSFIAVGVGHLPGDEGLINLLRKAGYRITPLKFKQ